MNPNAEQIKGITRALTPVIAGALGYFFSDANAALIAAGIVGAISAVWATMTHTEGNAVSVVDAIANEPESAVKAVILKPTVAGSAMNKETSNKVVISGTDAAQKIAANDW